MPVDKKIVGQAMDDLTPTNAYFIDRKTQKVTRYTLQDAAALQQLKKNIAAEPQRFLQVPRPDPTDNMREVEAFIAQVHDPKLKEAMKRAMTSHKPFREFRDLLDTKPKEKREWEAFHRKHIEQKVDRFLKSSGLQ